MKERSLLQRKLIQSPIGDPRLLEPGWASDLAYDELEFLQAELSGNKKLASQWGFRPAAKHRPEWAIRQVAMWGDPKHRAANVVLARHNKDEHCNPNPRVTSKKDGSNESAIVIKAGAGVQLPFQA